MPVVDRDDAVEQSAGHVHALFEEADELDGRAFDTRSGMPGRVFLRVGFD